MRWDIILVYIVIYLSLFFTLVYFINFFENKRKLKNPKPKKFPKVSIIVPVFNEEETIAKTLTSLLNLRYPKNKLEIFVVDDGSTDKTYDIAKSFKKKGVVVLKKKNSGKSDSINYALKRASGELAGALDADSFVMPDALEKVVGYFENPRVMAVTPSIKIWKPHNIFQRMQFIEFLASSFMRKVMSFLGGVPFTPGPFTIYRISFFKKHGFYDTSTLTEDTELALRIESHKYIIENAIDVNVYTVGVPTFKGLLSQRIRWYRGMLDNFWNYRHMFSKRYGNLGLFGCGFYFDGRGCSCHLFRN